MATPSSSPLIFVSVSFKGLTFRVSRLESVFAGLPVSVASKRLSGAPIGKALRVPEGAGGAQLGQETTP